MNLHSKFYYTDVAAVFALIVTAAIMPAANAGGSDTATRDLACDNTGGGSVPPADLCIQASDADTNWRWIGKTVSENCPMPAGWTSEKLFEQPSGTIPPGLRPFCLFEATTPMPNIASLTGKLCTAPGPPPNCLSQLDPDSVSMAMMGSDEANLIWEQLRDHFLEQIGKTDPLPDLPQNVRIAVIDSEPTGFNEDLDGAGTSQHGFTLINLIRDMICPSTSSCAVQLKSRLALPLKRCASATGYCRDETNGGYVGTIGDLAAAIRTEVGLWETSSVDNLVINLSVAWNPLFGDDQPIANSRVAAQAVYRALQDARCRGALVIAASGNRVTGPDANLGALLPAGWETVDAPGFTACETLLDTLPDMADFAGTYRPLVHAAGAVRTDNTKAETREQGEPGLAAFGDHAVSEFDDDGTITPTQILTGSSVAAAVVSAAAAAVWHYSPDLSGYEVMDTVYGSGFNLGRQAEFCLGSLPCTRFVRRVTVCAAVDAACDSLPAGSCPVVDCTMPASIPPALAEDDIVALFAGASSYSIDLVTTQMPFDQCKPGFVFHWETGPVSTDPCPHLQYYGVQATPWADGQPEGQYCPTCVSGYRSPGTMYVEIDDSLQGILSEITLLCADDGYRIPGQLVAGDKLKITEIPETCEVENVALAYRLDNGTGSPSSVASPTLLIADIDDDNIQDALDNCILIPNADQNDGDGDGLGNVCDGDFTNNCFTNFLDFSVFVSTFNSSDPVTDLNGDGSVNFLDFIIFRDLFGQPPGPSGLDNVCSQ